MNLRDLEYFKYLAESLSFTKTAEHFFVSQPSISIALKRLEEEFETKLIQRERSAKNIRLTASGRTLYHRTIDMLNLFKQTKQEMSETVPESVQLGLISIIGSHYLPKLFAHIKGTDYQLSLIEENTADELIESLRAKTFPIAITIHEHEKFAQQWIDSYPISHAPIQLCVSKNHYLANYRELSIVELMNESFISLKPGTVHERLFYQWATQHKLPMETVQYTDNLYEVIEQVESGRRLALLTENTILSNDKIISIPVKNAPISYTSLIINNEATLSPEQAAFNQQLIDIVKNKSL
ncbi:LysR family transcriptional regulator [Aerococcaceae bacterium zg-ZUI334]|uniref:LysR family transcriptional regulator n=1 Tax=Aerococcaceae TaxID=186827 RepID=UPI0013B80EE3|nr:MULTISPECIES: LysR family transcriptional regulator [unclassified Facklamia]MBR7928089.1 LysR family transcriptional regulator [Aerococcaceae bacterium zg-ZUI334]NEW65139.1 LysR family transcriptional regulator [Facklamia sp. 252]NEW68669.1 LysR family transcriptional regulator [Facklamia sp. 253]QQD65532.1 LysR family transcriptional regulator [Aerococcaceae bacterium zg-252]